MDRAAAANELTASSEELRRFAPVSSFRAPNLDFPTGYLPLLASLGYRCDSSIARYKPGSVGARPHAAQGVWRVPASIPPSLVRLPSLVRSAVLATIPDPAVLFFHPWEFVDVRHEPLPLDCRFRTGEPALRALRAAIRFYKARSVRFVTMGELIPRPAPPTPR